MGLTIVIVNWNGGELLNRCLRSIRDSRTAFAVKVIVVDNDSSDGSREMAAEGFPEFRVINSGSNLGFGRANNLARPLVDTPLVLFLNPDTELMTDSLERAVECLSEREDVGALGCKMRYPGGAIQEQGLQWFPTPWTVLVELLFANRRSRRWFARWLPILDPCCSGYVRKLYGGFVLARKEALDRAGWFDERYFMYAEDVDLSRTLTDQGWRLFYCSEAEIVHVSGGASAKAPSGFAVLMKHESIAKLMRKYHGRSGQVFYRVAVGLAAAIRWVILAAARSIGWFVGRGVGVDGGDSMFRNRLMIRWALGLQGPTVAGSRMKRGLSVAGGSGA